MARGLDIGTLSGTIELTDNLSPEMALVIGKIDQLDGRLNNLSSNLSGNVAAGFITAEAAIAAFKGAASLAGDVIKQLTIEGAGVGDIVGNFEHLTASAGRLSSTLLNELREGTHNTITDLELIKIANQDLAAGMNLTDEQFRTLADGAFALAQATGEDVKTALEKMNDAMLTGRTRAVQMLTGKIDLTTAELNYAKQLGTTVERLSEEEKLQAARIAILEKVTEVTGRLGEQGDGLDEMWAQASTQLQNFVDKASMAAANSPVLQAGFKAVGDSVLSAFGGSQQEAINTIVRLTEDAAFAVIDFAKFTSDAIGIAGMTWNSLQIILETSLQGFRAIAIILEEIGLGFMKVANITSGGLLFEDAIKTTTASLDGLYARLVEGEQRLDGFVKAKEEWAIMTGRVNEKLDQIKDKMQAARAEQEKSTQSVDELAQGHRDAAQATTAFGDAQETAGAKVRMSAEEMKKQQAALAEIASSQKTWQETVRALDADVVKAIKGYMEAGVSQGALATAYGLTATQITAVNKALQEEQKALDAARDAAKKKAEAWAELKGLGEDFEDTVSRINARVLDQAKQFLEAGASARAVKEALGLTDSQMKAIQETMKMTTDRSKDLGNALRMNVGGAAEEVARKVRTLSGEMITLQEQADRRAAGGSFEVNRGNLAANAKTWGIPESAAFEMAKRGMSFQEIIAAWQSNQVKDWVPKGPRIPGFKDGGIGDFGEGTLAMLHGREAIIPLDKAGQNGFGNVTNYFYVNGTAADVARKVSEEIMKSLKRGRQFRA